MVYITTKQIAALNAATEKCREAERRYEAALCYTGGGRDEYIIAEYEAGRKAGLEAMSIALKGKGLPTWVGHTLSRVIAAGRVRELAYDGLSEICYFGQSDFGRVAEASDDGDWLLSPNGWRERMLASQEPADVGGIQSMHKGRAW